ncbi:hypothetical protein QTP88_016749 [Uroleucon formosanum]
MVKKQIQNINLFVKNAYYAYFGIKIGDQNKSRAPHKVCKICFEDLRNWTKGKKKALSFGIPMVWREPKNHGDNCYFCACNVQGLNIKNKKNIIHPDDIRSTIRPMPHGPTIPIPLPPINLDTILASESSDIDSNNSDYFEESCNTPQFFTQSELNDLIKDLDLPKDGSELLASRLRNKNLLAPGTLSSFYRNRKHEYVQYFTQEESLVYCNNIPKLINKLGNIEYNKNEWRLFIDSSKRSLKGVLLHNGNFLASVPVTHSVYLKETYDNLKFVLEKMKYLEHKWSICGDLKIIDNAFLNSMTTIEKNAWISFKEVINNFFGNIKSENYETIVNSMLENYRILGCSMSIKMHFLYSHLDKFPENLGDVSEEQSERFHQDIKEMERRYQGRWSVTMMADYCWMLQRETHYVYRRKSTKRSFFSEAKIFFKYEVILMSCFENIKTRPGADCGSDHQLLVTKLRIHLKNCKRPQHKTSQHINSKKEWERFETILQQKLRHEDTINNWSDLKQVFRTTKNEIIKERPRNQKNNCWFSKETIDFIEHRRELKVKGLHCTPQYNQLSAQIRREIRRDKNEIITETCKRI